ncbi:MAG: TrkH family potassium uptake protein [Bacteroidales bacterium]|nr:TrkH family potassium uptake protein [Bacteroidales bacterium]
MINFRVVAFILGILLVIEGAFMLLSAPVSLFYNDPDALYIFVSAFITAFSGFLLWAIFRNCNKSIGKREGYIIVSLGWILFSFFGSLPFYISNSIPSYTDAFFETMSGFTTTGASILVDYDESSNMFLLSHGLLFWRSMTQWLGGMGIIVLSLVILPILGIGGMQLFTAEVPGPTPDKLHPRIKETAKRLWGVYMFITLAEVILLVLGKMPLFDAVCHSFTTLATGGYSIKQESIAFYSSPYIQYVITFFMIVAGINFSLSYFSLKLKFKRVWSNEEFRAYLSFIGIFTVIITLLLIVNGDQAIEKSFRDALFQVVSIMTTTGYATVDYLNWVPSAVILLLVLMFFGGSAGSTGGSIKIVRVVLMLKNGFLELKRLIHPNAIVPVRLDKEAVKPEIITNVLAFISVYILITVIGVIVISSAGNDLDTSVGSVAATLGNIGPGIGDVGPALNYAGFGIFSKWFLSFLMLVGRLELFTVLILFTPSFWKK